MKKNYTEEMISLLAKSMIGKTFEEINDYQISEEDYNKGSFGHIFETNVFGYNINSISAPDFFEAGVELKVTPYKINKDKSLSAKERLVLNIINYMEEYKNDFYTSHFWFKNNKIQIVWYLWEKNKKKKDLRVTHEILFSFPKEDLKIIINDWNTIIEKIKIGKAHEISEADTMYLGACTKGANSSSVREQPFSEIKAKQRAFCLKVSYMTSLIRTYIGNYEEVEKILSRTSLSFNQYIQEIISKYKGMSQIELKIHFEIDSTAKNLNDLIIRKMFGVRGNLSKTDEFMKANIVPRTVRIEENGRIKESMPFSAFRFDELIKEEWDDSVIKNTLETTKYMFFIFKKYKDTYIFIGIKLWNMPIANIENDVKLVWDKTKKVIIDGNIVKEIDSKGNRITNFPRMIDNNVCHVRPHARNSKDTFPLPFNDKLTGVSSYTKHSFWLNNKYLEFILNEYL